MSEEQVTQAPAEGTEAQAANPDLTIQDLTALRTIIDVASQRGTFKANEMASVGQVYNRLDTFLNAVAKNQPAEGSAAPAAPTQGQ
jgi:hypothetical protein